MPKKVSEQINQYILELVYSGVDRAFAEDFGQYLLVLYDLAKKIDTLDKNDVKLTSGEIRNLQNKYNEAMEVGADLVRETGDEYDSHRKAIKHVVSKINNTLAKEVTELSKVLSTDKKSLKEITEKANSIHVDLSGKDLSFEGGQQNARMPLTYKDENGNEVKGYFTQTTTFDSKKDYEDLLNKCSDGNPLYREAFEAMVKKGNIFVYEGGKKSSAYQNKVDNINNVNDLKGLFEAELNTISNGTGKFNELNKDPKFSLKMLDFVTGYNGIYTKKLLLSEHAGVKEGSTLEERNAAMSAVADLLGVPNIIARSVKMKVKIGDKEISGVFMEQAKGDDLNKVKRTDPLYGLNNKHVENYISQKALKQISDLQVLDFICGNVDRHGGNMTFITKKNKNNVVFLDGIQGIDNDCAFGVMKTNRLIEGKNRMAGISDLHRMSTDMQARIMSLTPEILKATLRPYNLSEEQINACIDRTKMVQAVIQHQSGYVNDFEAVDDGKWDVLDAATDSDRGYIKNVIKSLGDDSLEDYVIDNHNTEIREKKMKVLNSKVEGKPLKESKIVEGKKYIKDNDKLEDAEINKSKDMKTLKDGLKSVKINSLRSSNEFDLVEECFKDIAKTDTQPTEKLSPNAMKDFKAKYKVLIKFADQYLEKKSKEERDLLYKGKAPSKLAKSRINLVEEMKKFAQTRIEVLDNKLGGRKQLINNAKISINGNINSAKKMIEDVKKEEPTAENKALVKHLEAKIVTNNTLNKAIDEHEADLSENEIDDMLPFSKQSKMIEKTKKVMEKKDEQPKVNAEDAKKKVEAEKNIEPVQKSMK